MHLLWASVSPTTQWEGWAGAVSKGLSTLAFVVLHPLGGTFGLVGSLV